MIQPIVYRTPTPKEIAKFREEFEKVQGSYVGQIKVLDEGVKYRISLGGWIVYGAFLFVVVIGGILGILTIANR